MKERAKLARNRCFDHALRSTPITNFCHRLTLILILLLIAWSRLRLEVEELLRSRGVKYSLIELRGRAVRSEDMIKQVVGYVEASEARKTVSLKGGSGKLYAALVLGGRRVQLSKVSEEVRGSGWRRERS